MWIRALQLHKHRNNVFFEEKKENKGGTNRADDKITGSGSPGFRLQGGKLRLCLGHRAQHNHLLFWDSDRGHELIEEPLWERDKPTQQLSKLCWGGGSGHRAPAGTGPWLGSPITAHTPCLNSSLV